MKASLVTLGMFVLLVSSCKLDSTQNSLDDGYSQIVKEMPTNFTDHMPVLPNLKNDYKFYISYPSEYSAFQVFVTQRESSTHIDSIIAESNKISNDSNLFLIVNKHLRKENLLRMPQSYHSFPIQEYHSSAVPIPNFYEIQEFSEFTNHNLKPGFDIYLLEYHLGKKYDGNYHSGDWHMPEKWKDGYSKGFAINREAKMVIYWTVIW